MERGASAQPLAGVPAADSAPAFGRAMRECAVAAFAAAGGGCVETYAFAGRPVRLGIAGARLAQRTQRAFAHLRVAAGPRTQALHIDLWDERECGVAAPPAEAFDGTRRWIACGGELTASADGRHVAFRYHDSITVLDRAAQRLIGCRRDGSLLAGGEYSKPLLLMLSIWYHDRGVQPLHAGALVCNGTGLLVPGESGTGKSTTCLAAISRGFGYVGDDFIGLECAADGEFRVHSIYSSACIARKNLDRFPEIRSYAVEDDHAAEEKPIFFLAELFPERVCASAPIGGIVLLSIGHERTDVRPAGRAEAMRQFAASTLHTVVPRPGRAALEKLAALIERVPAFRLELSPDPRDISSSIDHIAALAARRNAP